MTHSRLAPKQTITSTVLGSSTLALRPYQLADSQTLAFFCYDHQAACKAQFGPAQAGDVIYVTGAEVMYQLDSPALTTGVKNGTRSRSSFGLLPDDDVYG